MVFINAETFGKNDIYTIKKKKGNKSVLWIRIKDIGKKLGVKNIADLVDKEIKGKSESNYPTKQQIRKYKRHGSEFIENEKFMYANEYILVPIIMHCKTSTPKAINFKSKLGFTQ